MYLQASFRWLVEQLARSLWDRYLMDPRELYRPPTYLKLRPVVAATRKYPNLATTVLRQLLKNTKPSRLPSPHSYHRRRRRMSFRLEILIRADCTEILRLMLSTRPCILFPYQLAWNYSWPFSICFLSEHYHNWHQQVWLNLAHVLITSLHICIFTTSWFLGCLLIVGGFTVHTGERNVISKSDTLLNGKSSKPDLTTDKKKSFCLAYIDFPVSIPTKSKTSNFQPPHQMRICFVWRSH